MPKRNFVILAGFALMLSAGATDSSAQMLTNRMKSNTGANLCLAVKDGRIANSSPLITWDCIPGDPSQLFYLNGGMYHIGSPSSQYCLASYDGTNRGARLGVWQCQKNAAGVPDFSQTFSYGGNLDIRGPGNQCAGITNASNARGSTIILWDCQGAPNQMWQYPAQQVQPPPPPATPQNLTVNFRSLKIMSSLGSRCLGIEGGQAAEKKRVIIWDCLGLTDQDFVFMPNGEIHAFGGQMFNFPAAGAGFPATTAALCVEDFGGGMRENDSIDVFRCTGASNQKWRFTNGEFIASNGMLLDMRGGWFVGNQDAILFHRTGQNNQKFVLGLVVPRGTSTNPIGQNVQVGIAPRISVPSGYGLVGNSGGTLVAAGGGNLVAAGGGNIVAAGGGNIVAAGGGNVVSHDGASIIVPVLTGIVAAGGGN